MNSSNTAAEYYQGYELTPYIGQRNQSKAYLFFKRIMDIVGSLTGIILLAPLMLVVAILIKLDSKGPALFAQTRCGKKGKIFKMYKFRSMCSDAEKKKKELEHLNEAKCVIFKIKQDPRITKVGRFIRKTSIDELLQLFNVLKGEMSLVGPRPPVPGEVEKYDSWQRLRLSVKPGLTGLWQVSGRSNLEFDDMVRLDLQYIRERSFMMDIRLLVKTVPVVLKMEGAY